MNGALFLMMCAVGCIALSEAFPGNKPPQKQLDLSYHPPPPAPPKQQLNGEYKVGADAARGGGTKAYVNGRQEFYKDGKTRAEVYGGYGRTTGGGGDGNWNAKLGGRVEHKWGGGW